MKKQICMAEHTQPNYDVALRAAQEGRDMVRAKYYDGQNYHRKIYRVTDLKLLSDNRVVGITEEGDEWAATSKLCRYARTGQI